MNMAGTSPNTLEKSYVHHLVWLDKNIENYTNKQKLNQWHELDDKIKLFSNKEDCIDYIQRQDDKNTKSYIIFIISDSFSQQVIPHIHNCTCILAIFIFSTNSENCQNLKYPKLRAICVDISDLFNRIRNCMDRDKVSIAFSLFNKRDSTDAETTSLKDKSDEQYPIRNLKEDQARFLWFYKCHHFMIELEDDDRQAKEEMISCFRTKFNKNERILKPIDEFEKQSLDDNAKHAIWWYSHNSIMFRCINEALISGNISVIYSYRYIIKLLCRQLKILHKEYKKSITNNKLHLYRGQRLKLSLILLISKHINDLISLNSFVSTTLEEDIAKKFCLGRSKNNDEPVIFEIDIDLNSEQSIPFADIRQISRYPEEEEILISIGSIFRIESVNFDEKNELYRIHLSLSQHDQLTVNKYIEQTFATEIDSTNQSILFGKLLFDMGEFEFAIEYFDNKIRCLSDHNNHYRPTYLNNIGVCYNEIGRKDQAFKYYRMASQIYKQTKNQRGLGACYHNIASFYYDQGDYGSALRWALDALNERQEYQLERASTLDLLGCIQLAQRDAEAAMNNLQEALSIRIKYLGQINPNHPDIGISYFNLGKLDSKLSLFIDAQNNYSRAEEIFRHNYPKTHPLITEITQCLEQIKRRFQH
ncbi:unnamed protein product [Rotaria sordida]|uniref:NAD(P)(+)--arginine ADP-ribosyltransferase n=1 Tax=Rotaria sordida TaxID=392033 RepID=A0A813WMT4_9BILA|nr:unnamed protein product [Rotaria sordida]CAF3653559.1 unnamed protein product [Rotaria sordida]